MRPIPVDVVTQKLPLNEEPRLASAASIDRSSSRQAPRVKFHHIAAKSNSCKKATPSKTIELFRGDDIGGVRRNPSVGGHERRYPEILEATKPAASLWPN